MLEASCDEAALVDMHTVERQLETMNSASDEMNTVQSHLADMKQLRYQRVERWKDESTSFVRALPGVDVTKAALYYECECQCRLAHSAVVEASASYSLAVEAGASQSEIEVVAAAHVRSLTQYQSARNCLAMVRSSSKLSRSALRVALPYYDAELVHLQELTKLDATIKQLAQRFADAKASYRSALQELESISEGAHQRRSCR
jgi:uncharacterized protein YhaN